MAAVNREAIDAFMAITEASESFALRKLEEHGGDLNDAVNAHFSEGERSMPTAYNPANGPTVSLPEDDLMDIDDGDFGISSSIPVVSHPRDVREMPVEAKDAGDASVHPADALIIEDVTGAQIPHCPEIHGTVTIDDDEEDDGGDDDDDVEEEMVRAAIEASKREAQKLIEPQTHGLEADVKDTELAHAVSLSLKTAEQENAAPDRRGDVKVSEVGCYPTKMELRKITTSNGRLEIGSSYANGGDGGGGDDDDDDDDVDVIQPLVKRRSRHKCSSSIEFYKEDENLKSIFPSSPRSSTEACNMGKHPLGNGNALLSDEWGCISSEEQDEAVMLEAAMFGGLPEGNAYHYSHERNNFVRPNGTCPPRMACPPPSSALQAQRLLREQQDDEYLASLAVDREKEMKAMEEADVLRFKEAAAKKNALLEVQKKEEESYWRFVEEEEIERQLATKEASLPQEPPTDDDDAVALLVRMPDGTRRGRRFLKFDTIQSIFDFIDISRNVKPGTYRLVKPCSKVAFGLGEREKTLNELGLTSKQEALFLELI